MHRFQRAATLNGKLTNLPTEFDGVLLFFLLDTFALSEPYVYVDSFCLPTAVGDKGNLVFLPSYLPLVGGNL
eukprot:scaffold535_cov65-Cylindrotheca_fusiformis.AAC.8